MATVGADCRFFLEGHCSFGIVCANRHVAAARKSTTPCPAFAKGTCVKLNCALRHTSSFNDRSKIKCHFLPNCLKKDCPFQHPKNHPKTRVAKKAATSAKKTSKSTSPVKIPRASIPTTTVEPSPSLPVDTTLPTSEDQSSTMLQGQPIVMQAPLMQPSVMQPPPQGSVMQPLPQAPVMQPPPQGSVMQPPPQTSVMQGPPQFNPGLPSQLLPPPMSSQQPLVGLPAPPTVMTSVAMPPVQGFVPHVHPLNLPPPPLPGLEPPPPGMSPPPPSQSIPVNHSILPGHSRLPPGQPLPPPQNLAPPRQILPPGQPLAPGFLPPGFLPPTSSQFSGAPPFLPDLSRPPPGPAHSGPPGPGRTVMDFFSDMVGPKAVMPGPYLNQDIYHPTPQPGPVPLMETYYVPLQPEPALTTAMPPHDPHRNVSILPRPNASTSYHSGVSKRRRRSTSRSSESSYSSRSPTPPRSPLRATSGARDRDRYGRRRHDGRGDRRRSRSRDRATNGRHRYDSPNNRDGRRGARGTKEGQRPARRDKSSPKPVATTASTATTAPSVLPGPTPTPTPTAPPAEPKKEAGEQVAGSETPTVQKTESPDAALQTKEATPSKEGAQAKDAVTIDMAVTSEAGDVAAADSLTSTAESATSHATTTGDDAEAETASAATDDDDNADAILQTEINVEEDILELGIDEDELLAEVQLEEQTLEEKTRERHRRTRKDSDEWRKRREERWKAQEEEREQRRRERLREDDERRREERERRRNWEKASSLERSVGVGKTLPDRPSVVRIASKLKSSGEETSDAQSSQAQSPPKGEDAIDIMDEDALLAVMRERALRSMREKQRQKVLELKEKRRQERIKLAQNPNKETEPKKRRSDEGVSIAESHATDAAKRKKLGPVAAALLVGGQKASTPEPKPAVPATKKTLSAEEEEKLLMSSDSETEEENPTMESPPRKTEDADAQKRQTIQKILPPGEKHVKPSKTIISLKSSKWAIPNKKDDQADHADQADKENLQKQKLPKLKSDLLVLVAPTLEEPKKVISLVQSRIVSKVPSPKPTTAIDRLGSPVEDESSNDSMSSSSSSSSSIDDENEIITARPSVVQLAAAVKAGESTASHAYELPAPPSPTAPPDERRDDATSAEDRWNDAVAQNKRRKADLARAAQLKVIGGRDPISYEDLDSAYGTSSKPNLEDSVKSSAKAKDATLAHLPVTKTVKRKARAPSPVKFSPTTKDDIADLLDLTAPPSPSKASKTEDVDAAKLLDGISIPDIASLGKRAPPARPTWGRRRIEAPDAGASAASRKLVIRRSTGPAAVALATGGDATREIEERRRRRADDDDESGSATTVPEAVDTLVPSSHVASRQVTTTASRTVTPAAKPATTKRKGVGIQRPAWLASKTSQALAPLAPKTPILPDPSPPAPLSATVPTPPPPPEKPSRNPREVKSPVRSNEKLVAAAEALTPPPKTEAPPGPASISVIKPKISHNSSSKEEKPSSHCLPSASASSVDDDDLEDYADVTKATTNIADEMSKMDSDDEDLFREIDSFLS